MSFGGQFHFERKYGNQDSFLGGCSFLICFSSVFFIRVLFLLRNTTRHLVVMSPLSSPVCDIIRLSLFFMILAISKHTSQIVYRMSLNLDLSQNYSGVMGLGNEYHRRWSAPLSCIRGSMGSTSLSLVIWTLWYLAVSPLQSHNHSVSIRYASEGQSTLKREGRGK